MTLSQNIYFRRNGNMRFWRIGRLGGSFYIASKTSNPAAKREIKAARTAANKAAFTMLRRAVAIAEMQRA